MNKIMSDVSKGGSIPDNSHSASKVSPLSKAHVPRSNHVKLVINPISVGMVPVRSFSSFMIKYEREQKDAFEIE